MRHRNSGVKLGRTSSHRKAMFQNLANSLFEQYRDDVVTSLSGSQISDTGFF